MSSQVEKEEPLPGIQKHPANDPPSAIDLDAIVNTTSSAQPLPGTGSIPGALIGIVDGWSDDGRPLVTVTDLNETAAPASCAVDPAQLQIGNQVVVVFERGDKSRPIVMAKLFEPDSKRDAPPVTEFQLPIIEEEGVQAKVDNERLVVKAKKEIVLQCGKASLTLTRSGKVLIRGAYVSSRSSGVNRLKGGSVHIN